MGNKSGGTAERSAKQGQESSRKMGKDSLGRASGQATNPGIGTANGSDSGAGGDTVNAPGGTSSGTESGDGTASPGVRK